MRQGMTRRRRLRNSRDRLEEVAVTGAMAGLGHQGVAAWRV